MKKIREELSKYLVIVKKESDHTRTMVITFKRLLHKQLGGKSHPTEEEVKEAIMQLKDVGKITALLPLVALPGSILTIPVLVKIGKYYNIDILPKIKK
ncbi:MAG: hypothetical protein K8R39_11915 [Arcobacteraceae bacterium]|nr:hypothetical protein [Arcobacteraceae bacterium]